jgi:ribonucleoside-diphosphate reductase beta chain
MEAWLKQQQIHWLAEEVPMHEDVKEWSTKLTPAEISLLSAIFRFFTQSDTEVANNYNQRYMPVFKPIEVLMMLTSFANMEGVHQHAYSYLLDTVGMPASEYQTFFQYAEMKEKWEYYQTFRHDSKHDIAKTLAAFGGFVEGVQLFASFAILLSFPRRGLMRGMGQIITWSVRDETLHCLSLIRLFRTFIHENPEIWTDDLKREIYETCETMVHHEDAFVDLAFSGGPIEGLTAEEVKSYVRFIADRRLTQLGMHTIYGVETNPLPWLDDLLSAPEHTNFFEQRATEYSKATTEGTWEEAFADDTFSAAAD